jgi:hypothetical protein
MWNIIITHLFDEWFNGQQESLQDEVLSKLNILSEFGQNLGRPHVDTLKASKYPNMKELRIQHLGLPIRVFFAFDPKRNAIILCAGNKKGLNEKLFYTEMIRLSDSQFDEYLNQ